MCKCISDIEAKILENVKETRRYKRQVVSVRMRGVAFPIIGEIITCRTYNALHVTLDGQKKPMEESMFHTFCPFCGKKYGVDDVKAGEGGVMDGTNRTTSGAIGQP